MSFIDPTFDALLRKMFIAQLSVEAARGSFVFVGAPELAEPMSRVWVEACFSAFVVLSQKIGVQAALETLRIV